MKIVLGSGPSNARIFICGEGPGKVEAETGIPFTGPSGKKLDDYLVFSNLPSLKSCYKTNVIKEYTDKNPDPTPQQIADWTPTLLSELEEVKPQVIIAVGRYAAQWFLGSNCGDLETIHGMAHYPSRPHLLESIRDSIIFPAFHPAGGLWNYERRSIIRYGYELIGWSLSRLDKGLPVHYRHDSFAGKEFYRDVGGKELSLLLKTEENWSVNNIIGLDTEGTPDDPWSIQISFTLGTGFLLRTFRKDFKIGVEALSNFLRKRRPLIAMHQASTPVCACYDVVMCRAMGLELQGLDWFDTMYQSYLYRLESQANKTLCERWQGMEMEDYESTIGGIGREKQIDYLMRALDPTKGFSKPEKRREKLNTGRIKESQPKHIHASINAILRDIHDGKETKDGPTDPHKRWNQLRESNPSQVRQVESLLGRMPIGTLNDVTLEKAIHYSCRDSDGTLRNAITFIQRNDGRLSSLMSEGMRILPLIETRQRNGMPVSISRISSLYDEMDREVDPLLEELSNEYWEGKDFNPQSPKQVASLCRRLGLKPALRTKTGAASTSKKSIEEYRFTEPAIALVFDCRERMHNRDYYCADVLARVPDGYTSDLLTIHANFKPTKIPTRREAAKNPNILGIPVRTELGKKVRECYIAPPGKIWCGFDLSGIEVRCLTHLSRDPLWINAFERKINPHKDTASRLFNVPISDVTDLQKAVAKTVNFLIIYGGGASNLYDQLRSNNIRGYTLDSCRNLIRDWYRTYSGVDEFRHKVIAEAKKSELSMDYWGMIRYLPGINCGDKEIEAEEGRASVSQKVQGLAKGMVIRASIWLDTYIRDLISSGDLDPECWRLDVHDELLFLVNEGEEETLGEIVLHALTKHSGIDLIVPIEAESHYGYTWAACK